MCACVSSQDKERYQRQMAEFKAGGGGAKGSGGGAGDDDGGGDD